MEPNPFPEDIEKQFAEIDSLMMKLLGELLGTQKHVIVNKIEDVPQAMIDANIADLDEEFGG